jgi:hypothetical protein
MSIAPITVRVLEHHAWFHIAGGLSLGDIAVGSGTIALAVFTAKLAKATYTLDKRSAARERRRDERRVRGVARLVDGELDVTRNTISAGLDTGFWTLDWLVPRGVWDKDGAMLAESVPEDEAQALIDLFSDLAWWAAMVAGAKERSSGDSLPLEQGSDRIQRLGIIRAKIDTVRRDLHRHAYPDGRDLEPDPDAPRRSRRLGGKRQG